MTNINSFPVATHSYFRAINVDSERAKFLESPDYIPKFAYKNYFNEDVIKSRLSNLDINSGDYQSLQCVLSGIRFQKDDNEFGTFRQINTKLFGVPNEVLAKKLFSYLLSAGHGENSIYYDELNDIFGDILPPKVQLGPTDDIFQKYKKYFEKYRNVSAHRDKDVAGAIKRELFSSGLSDQGWSLKIVDDNTHARTCHRNKFIKIGANYNPRKLNAAERIAVHEVYGHALRGAQNSVAESEGFALMLEQLLSDSFRFRRSYRYLAASLGYGIFGKPMNFREVFEIMWRIMLIASKYSEQDAKKHAFDECYRVFRGGRPDIPGAVFIKDIIYFESNIAIWSELATKKVNYHDFVNIIEGRSTIKA